MYPARTPETERAYASGIVRATDLMGGKVDLTGYPLRYLSIAEYGSAGGRHAVFTAVGWLEQNGWEAVNAFWERDAAFSMLVRRVQPPVQDA